MRILSSALGHPETPVACSHWMASLVAHSNVLMSEKKSWMGHQCTPLPRQSDCGFQQSFRCGNVKQSYQWCRGWARTNAPIMPSTGGTDAATSIWNHSAKFAGNSILSPASNLQIHCVDMPPSLSGSENQNWIGLQKTLWVRDEVSVCSNELHLQLRSFLKAVYFLTGVQKQIKHFLGAYPRSTKRAFELSKVMFWLCKTDITLWPHIATSRNRTSWITTKLWRADDQTNSVAPLPLITANERKKMMQQPPSFPSK